MTFIKEYRIQLLFIIGVVSLSLGGIFTRTPHKKAYVFQSCG
jgi:hypothetical protein